MWWQYHLSYFGAIDALHKAAEQHGCVAGIAGVYVDHPALKRSSPDPSGSGRNHVPVLHGNPERNIKIAAITLYLAAGYLQAESGIRRLVFR
jgi:hypothetical protein